MVAQLLPQSLKRQQLQKKKIFISGGNFVYEIWQSI